MTPENRDISKRVAWVVVALVALSLVAGAIVGALRGNAANLSLPPCPTEDSTHCYWDADTMGNGQGRDVVNR